MRHSHNSVSIFTKLGTLVSHLPFSIKKKYKVIFFGVLPPRAQAVVGQLQLQLPPPPPGSSQGVRPPADALAHNQFEYSPDKSAAKGPLMSGKWIALALSFQRKLIFFTPVINYMVLWPRWKLAHHCPSARCVPHLSWQMDLFNNGGWGSLTWRYCADCGSPSACGANKSSASPSW